MVKILMVITLKKIKRNTLIFIILFVLFNISEIDSNSEKRLYYDKNDIHTQEVYKIYFKNMNTNELKDILNILNIEVINYIINDKKYYTEDLEQLINDYLINLSLEEKIEYQLKGIKVDGITVICETNEIIKLENISKVY